MREITSKITAVQVYRRGATVVRAAELTVEGALPDEVTFTDLPLSLVDPTARVRVLATEPADARVVAAGVRVGLWARPGDPPPKAPEQKELDALLRQLRHAGEQLAFIDEELALLSGVPVPERPTGEEGKPPPASPMAARLQLEQFVDDATRQRLSERRELVERVRTLEEEVQRVRERIAAASSAAQVHQSALTKGAVVRLRSTGAAPKRVQLELSYVVPGARWAPAYQCKLDRTGQKAEIQLRAWIAQRSGEDWRGVKLRLSTASPLSFTELPELSALKIGRAQPPAPKKGFRPPPAGAEVLFRDHDRDLGRAGALLPAPSPALDVDLDGAHAPSLRSRRDTGEVKKRKMAPRSVDMDGAGGLAAVGSAVFEAAAAPMDDMDEDLMLGEEAEESDSLVLSKSVAMRAAPPPASMPMAAAAPAPMRPPPPGGPRGGASKGGGAPDEVVQAFTFPLLRLPEARDASGRGKLMPLDARTVYLESAQKLGRPLGFDVLAAIQRAEAEAIGVAHAPVPDGCVDADDISSHFDFAYEADGVVEIVGDGGFHSVALGDRQSEARMRYIAVPREEAAVYRVAMLSNPVPAPLLPGPAEVYVGGEYVLTTRLPTVAARGELKLGLGVEQAIKIARNTKYGEVRSGEKVVAMTELVHDVDIDVTNLLEREIELEVRERIPIPATGAEVVVDETEVAPIWVAYDQEERGQPIEGGRRWEVKIAAGAKQRLHARYTVKIYANNELVGGNRRES